MAKPGSLYSFASNPLLKRFGRHVKDQAGEFAANPYQYVQESARAALPPDPLGGYNEKGVPQANPLMAKWLADNVGFGALTVYHGSPHKFDKFDMSKIGTGEGAQAYGHGLYFAESPEVAKRYADEVKNTAAVDDINNRMRDLARTMSNDALPGEYRKYRTQAGNDAAAEYDKLMAARESIYRDPGNFYKVDIPDESIRQMIDLDAPMSQQPKALIDYLLSADLSYLPKARTRRTLEAYIEQAKAGKAGPISNMPEPDGQMIHSALTDFGTDTARSEALTRAMSDAGIPGIKYFDGQSRAGAEGTRNFVLFDDRLPRILERNGQATGLKPWKPGEYRNLLLNAMESSR